MISHRFVEFWHPPEGDRVRRWATRTEAGLRPSLARLADVLVRYSNFTLGGGGATTATLHDQIVTRRRWVGDQDFNLCFALGRLTPGTNVLAFCTGIGWLLRGLPGAAVALLAASLPCSAIVVMLSWQGNSVAETAIRGTVAAAVAITAKTSWTIARPIYDGGARLRVLLVGAASFGLNVGVGIPAIYVLLIAAMAGAALPGDKA